MKVHYQHLLIFLHIKKLYQVLQNELWLWQKMSNDIGRK